MLLRLASLLAGLIFGDRMARLVAYRVHRRREQAARKARMLLLIAEGWAA